ncbi:MAG: dipeptidyl peptidase 3 [Ruminococcus sp.]|nr:dipeptidyl peptidase 3 [Ruminococcus sp.]
MDNFNTISIIGKYPEEFGEAELRGSKYDSFDLLLNDYLKLLFYTLSKNGIIYSTERNGILARVQFVDGIFINYVQPSVGKWDFENSKYQRIVSLNFVLYLFNEMCMANALYRINYLAEPYDLNNLDYAIKDEIDLSEVNIPNIVKRYNEFMHEAYLKDKGLANKFDSYSEKEINEIVLLYNILTRVLLYSAGFKNVLDNIRSANELQTQMSKGQITFEDLSEQQQDLLEEYDDQNFENYSDYYPCLGYFYHYIKTHVIRELGMEEREFDKSVSHNSSYDGLKLAQKGIFHNPIIAYVEEYDDDCRIEIDFTNAPEFNEIGRELNRKRTDN